jgi:hypothetical protein
VLRTLLGFLYGSVPAEFKSAYGLTESVTRLKAATRRSAFSVMGQQAAAGPVSESRVRLQRVIPMMGNSFKPFFGRFEVRADAVYLTGRFTMLGLIKTFMTLWLGGVLAIAIAFTVHRINTPGSEWLPALAGFGMFGGGVAVVGFGKWLARNDPPWLSDKIRTALGSPSADPASVASATTPPNADVPSSVPTVLRVVALLFAFTGLMSVWSAISGISSWHATPGHTVITHFSSWSPRLAIGAYGLCTLGLAIGVYRRNPAAWRLGLAFLIATGLISSFRAFTFADFPDSLTVRTIFCMLSLAATAYWSWWWYGQRIHFSCDT